MCIPYQAASDTCREFPPTDKSENRAVSASCQHNTHRAPKDREMKYAKGVGGYGVDAESDCHGPFVCSVCNDVVFRIYASHCGRRTAHFRHKRVSRSKPCPAARLNTSELFKRTMTSSPRSGVSSSVRERDDYAEHSDHLSKCRLAPNRDSPLFTRAAEGS